MKNKKHEELLTAFIDNELKSQEELRAFEEALKEDPSLEFDLKAESLTKNILKNRSVRDKMPGKRKEGILRALAAERISTQKKFTFKENIYNRKFIGFSTAAVILIAIILLLFNRPPGVNIGINISKQTGENNIVVLAANNFEKYMAGDKSVQFVSNNPEEIKNYFRTNGVDYETYIPDFDNYSLVGAFVTDHKGVKLANHIYSSPDGKYIYIFQVHENYLQGDSIVRITNDLLNYLKLGNDYKTTQKEYITVLKHKDKKVFAMVSNLDAEKLPINFYK
ncbi:MAG TPA: hypothetical protein VKA26_04045 [Ignavibacteriaceae bacterium]|nr:hypothetical protein [Ignavibacteriaceae bacterium]